MTTLTGHFIGVVDDLDVRIFWYTDDFEEPVIEALEVNLTNTIKEDNWVDVNRKDFQYHFIRWLEDRFYRKTQQDVKLAWLEDGSEYEYERVPEDYDWMQT